MSELYRFFSYSQYSLDSLANKYLYFSSINDFNDPFEGVNVSGLTKKKSLDMEDSRLIVLHQKISKRLGKTDGIYAISNEKFMELILKGASLTPFKADLLDRFQELVDEIYEKEILNKKHCCFIQNDSYNGCLALENKLMWSHYANGMRGFAIEFSQEALMDSIDEQLYSADMFYGKLADINVLDALEELLDGNDKRLLRLFHAKSIEWNYENEFRLSSTKHKVNYGISGIKSIVIGFKMTKEHKHTLFTLLRGIGVTDLSKVKEAVIDTDTLDIRVDDSKDFAIFMSKPLLP